MFDLPEIKHSLPYGLRNWRSTQSAECEHVQTIILTLDIIGVQEKTDMELCDSLNDKQIKTSIVADCVKLIDEQVAAKSGLSGMGLKAAYGAVKGIKPGYVQTAITRLLPETFAAIEPIWKEGLQTGDPVEHLVQNRSRTADMILGITDARIQKSSNSIIRSSYKQFRKSVKGDVENAVPGLAKIIGNHVQIRQETSLEG